MGDLKSSNLSAFHSGQRKQLIEQFDTGISLLNDVTATAAELNIMDGVLATAGEINRAADPDSSFEILTALDTLTIADHNKVFYLNSATEFAVTLPAAADADGMHVRFFVKAAPSGASYTVVTAASEQVLGGKVISAAGDAGDVENAATGTTITFVDGQAVFGDTAELWCDGASWYALCHASVAAGITITG